MSGKVIDGYCDVGLFLKRNSGVLFTFNSELQLAGGRHFGTKAENELLCAPKIDCVRAAEVMEKHEDCWVEILSLQPFLEKINSLFHSNKKKLIENYDPKIEAAFIALMQYMAKWNNYLY